MHIIQRLFRTRDGQPTPTVWTRRRVSGVIVAATVTVLGVPSLATAVQPTDGKETTYYISLGDSLATGYQPGWEGESDVAYPDQLFKKLKQREPGLQHLRLGCTGETTDSLVNGGKCDYPNAKSQLDAALKAMAEHRGKISYVTLNIGANDINQCVEATGALDELCLGTTTQSIAKNLAQMTSALRQAGAEGTRYAGATYYNPFLASWLLGEMGQQVAKDSASLIGAGNKIISQGYAAAGFKVANVDGAFSSDDFGNLVDAPGHGKVPANVATICQLTWQCSKRDPHPNAEGHRVIAGAFEAVLPASSTPQPPTDDAGPEPSGSHAPSELAATAGSKSSQGTGPEKLTEEGLADTGSSSSTLLFAGIGLVAVTAGVATSVAVRRRSGTR
ncbi:GDSL-type esterase/lipase family protein [Streptomyces sp. NPDC057101]|uniref:GDSL-type esterase/lipase family protein n=1 Tax=Streptomyces sp. NPDC057101 TaxID=3346020 RepID=UPI00363019EA